MKQLVTYGEISPQNDRRARPLAPARRRLLNGGSRCGTGGSPLDYPSSIDRYFSANKRIFASRFLILLAVPDPGRGSNQPLQGGGRRGPADGLTARSPPRRESASPRTPAPAGCGQRSAPRAEGMYESLVSAVQRRKGDSKCLRIRGFTGSCS